MGRIAESLLAAPNFGKFARYLSDELLALDAFYRLRLISNLKFSLCAQEKQFRI